MKRNSPLEPSRSILLGRGREPRDERGYELEMRPYPREYQHERACEHGRVEIGKDGQRSVEGVLFVPSVKKVTSSVGYRRRGCANGGRAYPAGVRSCGRARAPCPAGCSSRTRASYSGDGRVRRRPRPLPRSTSRCSAPRRRARAPRSSPREPPTRATRPRLSPPPRAVTILCRRLPRPVRETHPGAPPAPRSPWRPTPRPELCSSHHRVQHRFYLP